MTVLAPFFRNDLSWFDEFFKDQVRPTLQSVPCDVHETDKAFLITADLPGVEKDDIQIDFQNGLLTIAGKREETTEKSEGMCRRIERSRGTFSRSFRLSTEIDGEKLEASYLNGVLQVLLPKKEAAQTKKVAISDNKDFRKELKAEECKSCVS